MHGLGLNMTGIMTESSAVSSRLETWGEVVVGSVTTPTISISGAVRTTSISLLIDNSDYNGTVGDYSLTDVTITNQANGNSVSGKTITMSVDVAQLGDGRFLSPPNENLQSQVGAASGHTGRS